MIVSDAELKDRYLESHYSQNAIYEGWLDKALDLRRYKWQSICDLIQSAPLRRGSFVPGSVERQMMQISMYRSQFQGYCSIAKCCFDHKVGIRCLMSVRLEAKGWMSGERAIKWNWWRRA